jgi:hypothetical protein
VNSKIKNEDSLYKFLSFSGMLEKNRREEKLRNGEIRDEVAFGLTSFETFY